MDGLGGAYAAYKRFGYSAYYESVNYNRPLSIPLTFITDKDEFYFIDITPSYEQLAALQGSKVTILDHHQSAEKTIKKVHDDFGFDYKYTDTMSGAVISWLYFHPKKDVPRLLEHIQDRDLWQFELPYTHEILEALWSYEVNFELFEKYENSLSDLIFEGTILMRAKKQQIAKLARRYHIANIAGYSVPVINTQTLASDVCNALIEKFPDAPFVAYYYDTDEGRRIGLRSDGRIDVSQIAEKYGGGGHARASGIMIPNPQGETWQLPLPLI